MNTVNSVEQIVANVRRFDSYRTSGDSSAVAFYSERLRLGKIFVAAKLGDATVFCPSRFAGYRNNSMSKHIVFEYKNGSVTTPRITSLLQQQHVSNRSLEKKYLMLCSGLGVAPTRKPRSYWVMPNEIEVGELIDTLIDASDYPDEIGGTGEEYPEGSVKQVLVNAYERNSAARAACIAHHGTRCVVCAFDFEANYGSIGSGFTHVHHLHPLSLRSKSDCTDPVQDLRPVCPNCHAMLHRSSPPFSIEELKELMAQLK